MNKKKILKGKIERVVSGGTVVVTVSYAKRHPRYRKILRRTKRFLAQNEAAGVVGDSVKIVECRPLSKNKHFIVKEITVKK
jgi:small subunit ribosomal protein S17